MVDDKKQELKKFLRNYTEVVAVALGLLLVLLMLVIFRILALVSIGDLSNINPLITSGQNKLVLKDGTSEIIKIPIDSTVAKGSSSGKTAGSSSKDDTSVAKTDTSTAAGTGTGTGGVTGGGTTQSGSGSGSGSGTGTGGGSNNPVVTVSPSVSPSSSPSPSPVPTTAAFTAAIGPSVTYEKSGYTAYFGGCTITYKFTFTVTAQNAPGVAKAQWRWPGNSNWGNEFTVSFSAGQTSIPVSLQQNVSAATNSPQVISLRLNQPNATQKDYGFTHQCN